MEALIWLGVLIVSLVILVKAADFFVVASEKIGVLAGLSPFIVGVTIVALGTSLPELITSLIATFQSTDLHDITEIVAGNVLGSNIANILLIGGLAAVVGGTLVVTRSLINLDLPLLAASTGIVLLLLFWDGTITRGEGIIALLGYAVYLWYAIRGPLRESEESESEKTDLKTAEAQLVRDARHDGWFRPVSLVVVSGLFIFLGSKYTIDAVVKLSEILNLLPSVIAITAVAIGTSLPELLVSVKAALQKKPEIALGNIFGSNIFNGMVVLGAPALFRDLHVSEVTLSIGVPFLIIATLLYIFSGISKKIYKFEGAMFLVLYILFIGKLFALF